ncbi:MAG: hypothetical protein JXA67_01935, partial [Micromonosporaceae bacterium]|nr:hypothetical protein [Micromonosporaceae bacterium]
MAHSPTRIWTRAAKGTAAFVTALVAASPLFLVQPAAAASPDDVHGKPSVTRQAWKAGAATFGAHATPAQAVEAFWTPDRMRAAIPIEESAAYRAAVAAYTQAQAARAAQGGSAGSAKSPQDGPVRSVAPREGTVASTPVPAAHNPNYSYWEPTARTSGKVFFTMGNSNYACSAT